MSVQILNIEPGSDGDGRKWPKHTLERNDAYYLDKLADMWIKDLPGGPRPGVSYRIDRLPSGYAGFEKARAGDSKHVDRYIYGHPNGQFRSMTEFYPHFKHLMNNGGPAGCQCVKCMPAAKKAKEPAERKSKYFARASNGDDGAPLGPLISPMRVAGTLKKGRHASDDDVPQHRADADMEGSPDVLEQFIQRLKEAGTGVRLDEMIEEKMSPDWRAAESKVTEALAAMRNLPSLAPRAGELVLFVRKFGEGQHLAWDKGVNTFRCVDTEMTTWRDVPRWEVGVVTQMPQEEITERDWVTDEHKEQSIIYSRFRIEPLSELGSQSKPHARQYKHIPLHALRPFALWQDCLRTTPEKDWHPTIKHALAVSSSLCAVGRYRFVGTWPNASIFCRGLYLGPELILLGDTVRLVPKRGEQRGDAVTEAMLITSIRLRFVNLDFDEDDLAPSAPDLPYQTSLHVMGKVFTCDPSRSFNGVSKKPLDPTDAALPSILRGHGPWYHYTDPTNPASRVEIPFNRIAGRCSEHSALDLLFTTPRDIKTEMQPPAFRHVNAPKEATDSANVKLLSRGLLATKDARKYSQAHDPRLTSTQQLWFWADTRVEQLDLHEVNGRYVGVKDPMRTSEQLSRWRKALKGLDGKKGALEEYEAARKQRLAEERAALQSKGGMLGSAAVAAVDTEVEMGDSGGQEDSGDPEEEEKGDEGEAMDVDEPAVRKEERLGSSGAGPVQPRQEKVTIDLRDSESEDEMANDQLVGELFKNIRPGGKKG